MNQTPTVGRIVQYRIGGIDEIPELRPATIVAVRSGSGVNLSIALDGPNEKILGHDVTSVEIENGIAWRGTVPEGTAVGTWRWPART